MKSSIKKSKREFKEILLKLQVLHLLIYASASSPPCHIQKPQGSESYLATGLIWFILGCFCLQSLFVCASNLNTKLLNAMDNMPLLILGKEMGRVSSSSEICAQTTYINEGQRTKL